MKYIIMIVLVVAGFVSGIIWEHEAMLAEQVEVMEIANEACNARLATIRFTCKKRG